MSRHKTAAKRGAEICEERFGEKVDVGVATPAREQGRGAQLRSYVLGWLDSNEWAFMPPRCWRGTARERELWELRRLARGWMRARLIARQGWARTVTQTAVWPLLAVLKAALHVRHEPRDFRGSRSRWAAWGRTYGLAMVYNIQLSDQRDLCLNWPEARGRTRGYLVCRELQALLGATHREARGYPGIDGKRVFARFCAQQGLPSPATFSHGRDGGSELCAAWPEVDLMFKPANLGQGQGIAWLRFDAVERIWRDQRGEKIDASRVARWAQGRIGAEEWIVQEKLTNAASWRPYTTGALATCRVVTARTGADREPEVLGVFARFPRGEVAVDNLSAGGIGVGVDLVTGKMTRGCTWKGTLGNFAVHPLTGAKLEGEILPNFAELRELALAAHRAAGNWSSVGWDVAMTTRGAQLIEANLQWAVMFFLPMIETPLIEVVRGVFGDDYRKALRKALA